MYLKIKNRLEQELPRYLNYLDKAYSLQKTSPLLFGKIKEFILRPGKRIRPVLFIIGYLGFAKKAARGLYTSALSIELLHDFMLVHDDIIDKSPTRRGKPSMHAMFNRYLHGRGGAKFNGEDLSIIAGDIMYAMAIRSFLAIEEEPYHKENGLKRLIEAAIYTGSGEFIEVLYGIKDMAQTRKADIYKIYDLKTAYYTFATPLAAGAALAGAREKELDIISKYGLALGRAFQIKDDILGIFGSESATGKSNITDLKEGKKTILIWHAYSHADKKDKTKMKRIFTQGQVGKKELLQIRRIICKSGALDFAKKEVVTAKTKAGRLIEHSKIKPFYKELLDNYSKSVLKI